MVRILYRACKGLREPYLGLRPDGFATGLAPGYFRSPLRGWEQRQSTCTTGSTTATPAACAFLACDHRSMIPLLECRADNFAAQLGLAPFLLVDAIEHRRAVQPQRQAMQVFVRECEIVVSLIQDLV
jgi:hypothetical protein